MEAWGGGDVTDAERSWSAQAPRKPSNEKSALLSTLQEEWEAENAKRKKKEEEAAAATEAMADDVLHRILLKLNRRRMRPIDLFRKIDSQKLDRRSESCSADEFCDGLLWMGFEPSDKEFEVLIGRLDKEGTAGISLKQFDLAMKAVERKLADPKQTAGKEKKRAKTAMAALRSARPIVTSVCMSCGAKFDDDEAEICKMCGQRRPQGRRNLRKLLGYTPAHSSLMQPITSADEFMLKIVSQMNCRKYRTIDFFRTMDRDGSGVVSTQEFQVGLKKMGLTPSKDEFDFVMELLDQDGGGEISGAEFDKAAKLVVKKAKLEGRFEELDTWARGTCAGSQGDSWLPSTFSWNQRSIRAMPSGSLSERSARLHAQWSTASEGPRGMSASQGVGHGSVYDSSVQRERYFDSAYSGAHPTSTQMPELPLHKTVYKKAYFDGRFGKEPSIVPHPKMLRSNEMDRCLTATRGKFFNSARGNVKTFHNTPMMQSSVDQAVFGRDMDFSGHSKFDESFMALYTGCAGMASWHKSKD